MALPSCLVPFFPFYSFFIHLFSFLITPAIRKLQNGLGILPRPIFPLLFFFYCFIFVSNYPCNSKTPKWTWYFSPSPFLNNSPIAGVHQQSNYYLLPSAVPSAGLLYTHVHMTKKCLYNPKTFFHRLSILRHVADSQFL
jgi:hypothetical protein